MQYVNLIHITYMSKLVHTPCMRFRLYCSSKLMMHMCCKMMQKRRDIIINVLKNETQFWRVAFNPTIVKCIFAINRAMMGWVSKPNGTVFWICMLNLFSYKKVLYFLFIILLPATYDKNKCFQNYKHLRQLLLNNSVTTIE